MTQQAMGHYDGCSSLQLKIYEKIPIPDLPVSTMMEVHGHYFITQIAILLNLTILSHILLLCPGNFSSQEAIISDSGYCTFFYLILL